MIPTSWRSPPDPRRRAAPEHPPLPEPPRIPARPAPPPGRARGAPCRRRERTLPGIWSELDPPGGGVSSSRPAPLRFARGCGGNNTEAPPRVGGGARRGSRCARDVGVRHRGPECASLARGPEGVPVSWLERACMHAPRENTVRVTSCQEGQGQRRRRVWARCVRLPPPPDTHQPHTGMQNVLSQPNSPGPLFLRPPT